MPKRTATVWRDNMSRVGGVAVEETAHLHPRRSSVLALTRLMPLLVGNRMRTRFLRLAGIPVGSGTTIGGRVTVAGGSRGSEGLSIGRGCWINGGCHFDVSAPIDIGDGVALAQEVMVLTSTHRIGPHDHRAAEIESAPVTIGAGAWVGARVVILPGVTVGAGAIVATGAVVVADVPADTVVGGVPARPIRTLDPHGEDPDT